MSSEALQNPQDSATRRAVEAPQSGIVWLASYPKSGNTWTRAFLHNLMRVTSGKSQIQEINELDQFSVGIVSRPLFEQFLGFKVTDKHRDQIAATRARIQQHVADTVDGLALIKTHQALVADRGHPTINFSVTAGAIYIVRNPLDVAISYAHHLGQPLDSVIDFMNLKNAETEITEKQVNETYGSWSQHVLSWTRKPHPAIFVMRYEDMLAEPHKIFGALARQLLFTPTETELDDAINRSSFERLREQEEKDGFRERPEQAKRFFREGRAGQWKEVLTREQIKRVVDAHGEQMQRFGYLPI